VTAHQAVHSGFDGFHVLFVFFVSPSFLIFQ
jgi:hypothetical protein